MKNIRYVLLTMIAILLLSTVAVGCGGASQKVTFDQLISQATEYNGKSVTLNAFYFSGFEISALAGSLESASSGDRFVPAGTLIWVAGGISQELQNGLYTQTDTPSGYPEYFGELTVTGKFETGGAYGHLNAYQYQITITAAALVQWTPPPLPTTTATTGNLQIKVIDSNGQPLQGAKVVSQEQPDGQLKVTGLTDASGDVTFDDIDAGNYSFYISHADYAQLDVSLSVIGSQTTSLTFTLPGIGQAADDIVFTPGGPAYRANVHQMGVISPWPPVPTTNATLGNPGGQAEIEYRNNIQTDAGQTRNNLFYITLPDVSPTDTSLPPLTISLQAQNLPAGIIAVQTDLSWHDGDPARRAAAAMTVQVPADVAAGDYSFNIDVTLNGTDYGTLPCTVSVSG
jgi:hypothetical protein